MVSLGKCKNFAFSYCLVQVSASLWCRPLVSLCSPQRLHWTLPNLRTPEQSERWSDLMPLMSWQLWLAKDIVVETRLPWQSATLNLSPGRVAQSMFSVLVEIGTPARSPKPRGKSPGWTRGNTRTKPPRDPTVKKRVTRPKKSPKVSA